MARYRVSMDIGGTFTDVVTYDDDSGVFAATKASTTPGNLSEGVLTGLGSVVEQPSDIDFLVHGTTQGLNAFLERRGVPVLLLATAGVEDSYHIARGPRTRLYDLHYRKPTPLVPRRDVLGIGGRIAADGSELQPLDEQAVRDAARTARERGHGAIAVGFLFSYKNPSHELRAREILLEELGEDFTVSASHEAAKEWREYERTSSAVVESYTGPIVRRYLIDLEHRLADRGMSVPLHVMQSSGGILTAESARQRPLQTLLSGPVGGAIACAELSRQTGRHNLIGIDMGGTSFDVSLIVDGEPDVSAEAQLEGLPMLMSVVNIHTVGAGGGSVAWAEAGGLRVGPRSAGARPGPACYGRGGTEPTVTDANLVLGRVDPNGFAGGQLTLDTGLATTAVADLAEQFALEPVAMAEGICDVANSKMAQAIRTITVSRGIEPRDSALVAFGGAGPMHAVFLARELGITETIVPRFPGAFSAWGMLQTRIRQDYSEPYFFLDQDLDGADMAAVLARMEQSGLTALSHEGVHSDRRSATHAVDIRYAAQEYTLTVPLLDASEAATPGFVKTVAQRFAQLHESRYGHANLGAPIEFVTLRTTAFGDLGQPAAQKWPPAMSQEFPHEIREVIFEGQPHDAIVVRRDDLLVGHTFDGPAVVVEDTATTVVPPENSVSVDDIGSLIIRGKDQK
ncbi:hydantoinase/oxoprolinase family protein [Jatrophihabitans lederbergiae]|uniref:Hydantoinase/oxoprolinase family protein n=1 Tax=Jatrophihabitans lederbergiae TaxID=3075547 RepID=A0ABU2JCP9_9ACTN|nr:hydantoinase/oxoprolinase family protein [Jatrophihabitans sp. DSM 44399]MDT0262043.1 hydantoinase/oxoprolinase family protein [Jatrophihabitans sp. DSM 44399]